MCVAEDRFRFGHDFIALTLCRLQDLDTESYQRASRRSSALLKRLKDYYKEKKCNRGENIPEREASKTEVPTIDGRNLKTRSLSRSALLIENSKVVKKQRKSEDDMKSKNYTLTRSKSDGDVENGGESEKYRSIDDCDEDQDDGADLFQYFLHLCSLRKHLCSLL